MQITDVYNAYRANDKVNGSTRKNIRSSWLLITLDFRNYNLQTPQTHSWLLSGDISEWK